MLITKGVLILFSRILIHDSNFWGIEAALRRRCTRMHDSVRPVRSLKARLKQKSTSDTARHERAKEGINFRVKLRHRRRQRIVASGEGLLN